MTLVDRQQEAVKAARAKAEWQADSTAAKEARKAEYDARHAELRAALDDAQAKFDRHVALFAEVEAQWEVHYAEKLDDLTAAIAIADEAVSEAKRAVEAAGDAANVLVKAAAADGAPADGGAATTRTTGATGGGADDEVMQGAADCANAEADHPTPLPPLLDLITPPALEPPTTEEDKNRLFRLKLLLQQWNAQDVDWPLSLDTLQLTPAQCATLVGEAAWQRAFPDGQAPSLDQPLKRSLIGVLNAALTNLEVATAARQGAADAATAAMTAVGKHARASRVIGKHK